MEMELRGIKDLLCVRMLILDIFSAFPSFAFQDRKKKKKNSPGCYGRFPNYIQFVK